MSDTPAQGPIRAIYDFFRSLKLAVVLILVLTALSVIATLIPQGRETSFYFVTYPVIGRALLILGFNTMFTSFLFLLPTALFFVNLSVCTIHRLLKSRSQKRRRHGPDIIHVGLLVLMVGALVTFYGRTEELVQLRIGESAQVPGGYVLTLDDFQFERYEDGSPKDWLSVVTVTRDGQIVEESSVIEVNSYLKLGSLKFYQSTYGLEEGLVLADLEGNRFWLTPGDIIPVGDDSGLVVESIAAAPLGAENVAVMEVWEGHEVTGKRSLGPGAAVGEWVIAEVVSGYVTGLQMVRDPGYVTVLVSLIMLTIGLFLTYIQKIGDNNV